MDESGGIDIIRDEPLVEEEATNASWRLNVKEFHLPTQNVVHHQNKSSFSFNALLRKPSESLH
jgi:hypothetical protein